MRTYCLSLVVLVVLTTGGPSVGYAGQSADPNDSSSQTAMAPLENPEPNSPDQFSGSSNIQNLFLRMIASIVLVVGLSVAALYLSKKVLPKVARGSAKEIRIVETVYLGPRKALHLVEVGHHKLLIGSTHESITPIATVSDAWLDLSKPPTDDMVNI